MIFIEKVGNTNPYLNIALDEYCIRNFNHGQDYLLFYINEPSIIIGRNQNTLEEINDAYVKENDIKIVRRISGGGAVYHDLNNLNFSFQTDYDQKSLNNFRKFTRPVINVLNNLGVPAELKGRNDIVVNDKKISGNAQYSNGKRMLSHGTLLLETDMEEIVNALNVKMSKIESKGHKSVRSRVGNINDFLDEPLDIKVFRDKLLEGLFEDRQEFEIYHLTEEEWKGVHQLKDEKFATWEWNYGKSPKFNIQRTKRFPAGEIDLRIDVEEGHIKHFKIYGDFFGSEPVEKLENHLIGSRYDYDELANLLEPVEIKNYFGDVPKNDFLNLVYGEDEVPAENGQG